MAERILLLFIGMRKQSEIIKEHYLTYILGLIIGILVQCTGPQDRLNDSDAAPLGQVDEAKWLASMQRSHAFVVTSSFT
jgi:hypothetical protein